jgi:soluble lytic murein transglycosylase-like protein
MTWRARLLWFLVGLLLVSLLATCINNANAALTLRIPATSLQYRLALTQAAGEQFGLDAPVARLAAQLQQESGWNPKAKSPYAQGLAQFTPPTAAWLPNICPRIGPPDPWDAGWSIRAQTCYDAWLYARAPGNGDCARWAMTLSAYNGGETARDRERALADKAGADPDIWFNQTARFRARTTGAWRENRDYVQRILLVLEPAYIDAGWPGKAVCV